MSSTAHLVLVHLHVQPVTQLLRFGGFCHAAAVGQKAHRQLRLLACVELSPDARGWDRAVSYAMLSIAISQLTWLSPQCRSSTPGWCSFGFCALRSWKHIAALDQLLDCCHSNYAHVSGGTLTAGPIQFREGAPCSRQNIAAPDQHAIDVEHEGWRSLRMGRLAAEAAAGCSSQCLLQRWQCR